MDELRRGGGGWRWMGRTAGGVRMAERVGDRGG